MNQARFAVTHCSQCGGSFGPGDAGFSHCEDHRAPTGAAMKPQPMSDAEIAGIVERFAGDDYPRWSHLERLNAEILVNLTLVARDAQWAAMIGEPVAWIDPSDLRLMHKDGRGCIAWPQQYPNATLQLYAIKETP